MRISDSPPRGPLTWRTAAAALALLLLLPGLVEHHAEPEPARGGHAPIAASYYPDASHPELPLHVDAVDRGETRPCAACLVQLHARSIQPDRFAAGVPPRPGRQLAVLAAPAVALRAVAPAGGRAPPLS
jgi:hypothetical protein